ncbi:MAG: alpha/beta hydrolase [Caulobacteraceae bacterium]
MGSAAPRKALLASLAAGLLWCAVPPANALAQPSEAARAASTFGPSADYRPPPGIAFKTAQVISEGARLHAEIFYSSAMGGKKLPTVIMAHGWGGTAAEFRPDAVDLARAGFLVITFDYRGWGESASRVILIGPEPPGDDDKVFTAKVQAIRGYIDPFEQIEDWFNVIDWAMDEPMVDPVRVGLRGTSFSGGYVVDIAALDPRIKAIVSDVGGIADRPDFARLEKSPAYVAFAAKEHEQAARMARGGTGYPPPFERSFGVLVGAPVGDKLLRWQPNTEAPFVHAPALFVLAGDDRINNNDTNGTLAYDRVKGPRKLVIIPGIRHFDIYTAKREEAIDLAIAWFDKYLKP